MNILLWFLQILLAVHTAVGAAWKLSNPAQMIPSLQAIPAGVWVAMSGLEMLCSLALVLPAMSRRFRTLAPIAAACIAAEMLLFSGLHLASGAAEHGPLVYWLVVAAVCAFVVFGRRGKRTLRQAERPLAA